jgi:hypothetical protein
MLFLMVILSGCNVLEVLPYRDRVYLEQHYVTVHLKVKPLVNYMVTNTNPLVQGYTDKSNSNNLVTGGALYLEIHYK